MGQYDFKLQYKKNRFFHHIKWSEMLNILFLIALCDDLTAFVV
jgi:hypothetical protein